VRFETVMVALGLMVAAVIIISTTKTPLPDNPRQHSTHVENCTEPCRLQVPDPPPGESIKPASNAPSAAASAKSDTAASNVAESSQSASPDPAIGSDPERSSIGAGDRTLEVQPGVAEPPRQAQSAQAASKPRDSAISLPVASVVPAEPITSRPVADRFDFIGPAVVSTLADHQSAPPRHEFASLPASELNSLPAASASAVPKPVRVLQALPPQSTLTADNSQQTPRSSKTPQVAGWRLMRTIKTEEVAGVTFDTAEPAPLLPVKKPGVAPGYAAPEIKESKIKRRVRPRTVSRPAPPKPPKSQPGSLADEPWKNRALFRDY